MKKLIATPRRPYGVRPDRHLHPEPSRGGSGGSVSDAEPSSSRVPVPTARGRYDRLHTREISRYGGLVAHAPTTPCVHDLYAGLGRLRSQRLVVSFWC